MFSFWFEAVCVCFLKKVFKSPNKMLFLTKCPEDLDIALARLAGPVSFLAAASGKTALSTSLLSNCEKLEALEVKLFISELFPEAKSCSGCQLPP